MLMIIYEFFSLSFFAFDIFHTEMFFNWPRSMIRLPFTSSKQKHNLEFTNVSYALIAYGGMSFTNFQKKRREKPVS